LDDDETTNPASAASVGQGSALASGLGRIVERLVGGTPASASLGRRPIAVALQGGGALGAFTWGVLDRLLEDDTVAIVSASGASAGAVNAVVMAAGLAAGGPEEARRQLDAFWREVGTTSPSRGLMATLSAFAMPFAMARMGAHPLRPPLEQMVDFEALRAAAPLDLMIAATRVRDGGLRLFRNSEITLDGVLASACLPMLHDPIMIDGEAYWDGGLSANPPLRALAMETAADDILLVQILPERNGDILRGSADVARRFGEIAFSTALHSEVAALADLQTLSREAGRFGPALARKLGRLRLHRLVAERSVPDLAEINPLQADLPLLLRLREAGRAAMAEWLAAAAVSPVPGPMPRL
jgi:NTE family protein